MSMATTAGLTNDESQADKWFSKEALPARPRGHRQQGGTQNTVLSQAKLNVIKTMIYIVVCFTVCIMPRSVYITYMNLAVETTSVYSLTLNAWGVLTLHNV